MMIIYNFVASYLVFLISKNIICSILFIIIIIITDYLLFLTTATIIIVATIFNIDK